ncbi:MAG: nucleotidyltransferase domain-containing protein [Desulfurococcales archaeon]|nr:nucleotidyltransferase domain-containing protein [Desulfurococcales archaeon]
MARSIIVFVSGMDGSGKSTIVEKLADKLRRRGLPVIVKWFRFPYFLTIPFLIIARLTGRTRVFEARGKRFSVHFFEHFPPVYKLLYAFDHSLYYLAKYGVSLVLPIVIVSDRGPLDNLVDLLADTGDYGASELLARGFLKMQGRGLTIYATASLSELMDRRPEARVDPKYRARLALYDTVLGSNSSIIKPIIIDTGRDPAFNEEILESIANVIARNYGHVGWGKRLGNPYLRALAASKAFILANWLLQGSRIADSSENFFRVVLDASAILLGLFAGSVTAAIGFFLVAHTASYILASNSPIALSYLNKSRPPWEAMKLLESYVRENKPGAYIQRIVVFGSVSREAARKYSDIDVRVVRSRGAVNAARALLWTMRLRIFALRNRLPLDVFITTPDKLGDIISAEEKGKIKDIYRGEATL